MSERRRGALAVGVLLVCLAAWLWPLGIGGRMPVGGDVTSFTLGLMAVLHRAYRDLRLPLWNDLWGYGFPGLAESQMGVYYPPHWFLYGLFETEYAYSASLVLHTFWGGLGAYWAARRFGAARGGSVLGAFAWAASGFFVIHLPHQWGYTVGSWMPWAWGLAWPLAQGAGTVRGALALAAVLALQVLPGHFQLAFITEVAVLLLAVWGLIERPAGWRRAFRGAVALAGAVGALAPLAALQLLPTYELARLADTPRDFAYLSGFATPPLHLITYVVPGLFHVSPLWRPVAWDPFHTSPEECLGYLGLVPLLLAFVALRRGLCREAATRALAWLALITLLFSFGPYLPGFDVLIALPGFSYFRAPARWSLATQLALGLLAARGFEMLGTAPGPCSIRSMGGFALTVAIGALLAVAAFELVLSCTASPGQPTVEAAFNRALRQLPWEGRPPDETPDRPTIAEIARKARERPGDALVIRGLLRRDQDPARARLDRDRFRIYIQELVPTAVLLMALLLSTVLCRRAATRTSAWALLGVCDLLWFGHALRPLDSAPLQPLTTLSPVLARLMREPDGTRLVSDLGNLPLISGVANLPPYRTLDRPVLPNLVPGPLIPGSPQHPILDEAIPRQRSILRTLGASLQLLDPRAARSAMPRLRESAAAIEPIADPNLAAWLTGSATDSPTFLLFRPGLATVRAWLYPHPGDQIDTAVTQLSPVGFLLGQPWQDEAVPLRTQSHTAEHLEVALDTTAAPATVVLAVLDDPEWTATLVGATGAREVPIQPLFREPGRRAGWMAVSIPEPGRWAVHLTYRGRAAYRGLAISGVAWCVWLLAYWRMSRRILRPSPSGLSP